MLLPAGLLLWAGLLLRRSRWHLLGIGLAVVGPIGFVLTHWSWGERSRQPSIRILQWTAGPVMNNAGPYARFIVDTNADITIVEGARPAAADPAMRAWAADVTLAIRGQFLIASRLPVLHLRTVAWADDIMLISMEVQRRDGSPLRLLIVDLPSDPDRSRVAIIDAAHALMNRLTVAPDLVLGDFNLTQGSRQLARFLPGYQPAWSTAGEGWGGTWPRTLPIYRLDHVLVRRGTGLHSITTIDPGCGRHRAQLIEAAATQDEPHGLPPAPSQ
jgi:endonuclease/exonuclease/phosphatase family metal-dependent hydrolase